MSTQKKLLADIEAYLEATGMAPTAFGWKCLHKPTFVFDLRKGSNPRASTIDRCYEYMRANRPRRRRRPKAQAAELAAA